MSLNTNCPPYSNNLTAFMRALLKSAQSPPQAGRFKLAASWTLNAVSVRRALDGGSEVRRHAHLLEHDVERRVAVESLDLAVPHVEEVRARNVDLCFCWLDHAGGRFHRAAKGSLNRQLYGYDVAHDITR